MRKILLIPAVFAFGLPVFQAEMSPAQFNSGSLRGNWMLEQSQGIELPQGSCQPGRTDRFSVRFNKLIWKAPSFRKMPSMTFTLRNQLRFTLGQKKPYSVSDRAGNSGEIWIEDGLLFHSYSNGVSLRFVRCR